MMKTMISMLFDILFCCGQFSKTKPAGGRRRQVLGLYGKSKTIFAVFGDDVASREIPKS
jgi:hypothetical protein